MSLAPFIVSLFLVRYIKKNSDGGWVRSRKAVFLKASLYIGIGILALELLLDIEPFSRWLWHVVLIIIAIFMYRANYITQARPLFFGILPFIFVGVFDDGLEVTNPNLHRTWSDFISAATVFSWIWLVSLWIINRKQQKVLGKERLLRHFEEERNRIIAARKEELEVMVNERTAELISQKVHLEKALADLNQIQAKLIQKEKLISLGELTAGIAHEIQNPLNFVNNFSEVSSELIEEMQEEREKDIRNFRAETEILELLKDNLAKIKHHGKRADAIVKGMLQHSRNTDGKFEPVDINALAEEYLRLSYHGLRAGDKEFNVLINKDFDYSLGEVNVLPQDFGRVILNLLSNAFYSVSEKRKQNLLGYQPAVWLKTEKLKDKISMKIKDNGLGISSKILNKIYQPFFTTKSVGEGTGLGLSLSYDIITKSHQGEMTVKSKEGEYAEFCILIPLNL